MADTEHADDARRALDRAGRQAVASGHTFLDHEALERTCHADGLASDALFRSLQVLQRDRLVDMHFVEPSRITLLRLTDRGIRRYLAETYGDLADIRYRLLEVLADSAPAGQGGEAVDVAGAVGQPALVVEVLMEDLQQEGRLVFNRAIGGRFRVHRFSGPG